MTDKRRFFTVGAFAASLVLLAGCRQGMYDQAKKKPLAESDFYRDGLASRVPPADSVARGQLREDGAYFRGVGADGKFVAVLPVPLTKELMARGRQRFDVFCSPCHGRQGNGNGMVVQRGFKVAGNYHQPRLRQQPVGYFFDVITNGFNQMSSYASQIPVADRWAIVAYVRALQLSQNAVVADLPVPDQAEIEKLAAAAPAHAGGHEPAAEGKK